MGRFKKGDQVTVNGELATLIFWPNNDEGPFRFTVKDKRTGIEVQKMNWTSKVDIMPSGETLGRKDIEDSASLITADVQLVKAGPEVAKKQGREIPLEVQQELEEEKAREAAEAAKDLVIENLKAELTALRAGAAAANVILPSLEPPDEGSDDALMGDANEPLLVNERDAELDANELLMAEPRDDLPKAMPRGWGHAAG